MFTLEEITPLVESKRLETDCLQECYDALTTQQITTLSNRAGSYSAHGAFQIWKIRQWTTQRANIPTCGFEETLRNLSLRPPEERIAGWAFKTADRAFLLFISIPTNDLVGCIRVMLRDKEREEIDASGNEVPAPHSGFIRCATPTDQTDRITKK